MSWRGALALSPILALLVLACSNSSENSPRTIDEAGAGSGGAEGGAPARTGGRAASGGAGSGGRDAGAAAGGVTSSGGAEATGGLGAVDASPSRDAAADTGAPQCLDIDQACDENNTCCEAYACRAGRCCVPNGVWSRCFTNSECCSNSCVLEQCTCVPLGYSCTGPGQCCSGFECRGGTCICPPDIRGCN